MTWSLFWSVSIIGFFLSISAADVLEEIEQKILNDHNKYRKQHHVPPLKSNDVLSKVAQDWSDQLLSMGALKHRPSTKFGENLWTGSGFSLDDMLTNEKANPVNSWYSEIKNYPQAPFQKWGHFTQLIWKGSKHLGCGISYDTDIIFVVCNYDPPGNWKNKYHENVFTVEGAPWSNNTVKDKDDMKEGSGKSGGKGGAGGSGKGDDAGSADDGGPSFTGSEDREEQLTPYWIYGLGFVVILLVVVFLAILIYYQKS